MLVYPFTVTSEVDIICWYQGLQRIYKSLVDMYVMICYTLLYILLHMKWSSLSNKHRLCILQAESGFYSVSLVCIWLYVGAPIYVLWGSDYVHMWAGFAWFKSSDFFDLNQNDFFNKNHDFFYFFYFNWF